jgi:hypothetical protein
MRPLAILLLTAAALSAQEATLGARVQALVPMGDLRDQTSSPVGLGTGVFLNIPLDGGWVLRPVVGAQFLPKGNTLGLAGTQTSVISVDLLMEALWFPEQDPDHGAYLVGSAGAQQWRVNATGTTPSTLSHTRLGVSGGVGYQFTPRLGAEARGFWSPITRTLTATGLTLGATLRF